MMVPVVALALAGYFAGVWFWLSIRPADAKAPEWMALLWPPLIVAILVVALVDLVRRK